MLIDFPPLSKIFYSTPLELVISNLWGPLHVPLMNGYLYYVSFVDVFS